MKKKRNTISVLNPKSEMIGNVIASVLCLVCAGAAVFLFWQNINKTMTKQNEEPIGFITFKNRIAQRRFGDRTAWDTLKNNSPIYNSDIIHTADLSEATITFVNGDKIELTENSLVQIYAGSNGTRLELAGGNINVQAAQGGKSALTLVAGGNEVKVDSGSLVSAGAGSAAFNVQVVEGNANITTSEGVTQMADAGTSVAIAQDGRVERKPSVVMLQPKPNIRLVNTDGVSVPVSFSWKISDFGSDESVRLEIARDSKFARVVNSFTVKGESPQTTEFQTGTWYWRVYPVGGAASAEAAVSATSGKIAIVSVPSITAVTPVSGKIFTYRTNLPSIRFGWEASSGDISYQFLIADNAQMVQPIYANTVTGTSLLYSGLEAGTWYWQVKPVFPEGYGAGEASGTRPASFRIEKSGGLPAPELLVPTSGNLVTAERGGNDIFFSWRNEAEADTYTISIATDRELRNAVLERQVKNNFFTYNTRDNLLREGEYYWGVTYKDKENLNSPASTVRSFVVSVPPELPDFSQSVAAAVAEMDIAKTSANRQDFSAAFDSYKKAGSLLGFTDAQNKIFLDGLASLQNLAEQDTLQRSLSAREAENALLQGDLARMQQTSADAQTQQQAQVEDLSRQLADRDAQIAQMTRAQEEAVRNLNSQNTASTAQVTALQRRVSQLEAENARLQESNSETDNNLQVQNANNSAQMAALQNRIIQLETDTTNLRQANQAAENQIANLQRTTSQLQTDKTNLNQIISELRQNLAIMTTNFNNMTANYNSVKPNFDAYMAMQKAYNLFVADPVRIASLEHFLNTREVATAFPQLPGRTKTINDDIAVSAKKEGIGTVSSIVETALRIQNKDTRKLYLEGMKVRYVSEPVILSFIDLLLKRL